MKCSVRLIIAGKVVEEVVNCNGYADAKQIVLSRYGNSKSVTVIGVNAIFD